MDPTTSANTNPFVSPTTGATMQSELAQPKSAYASATDPASINASSAGLGGIAPLSETSSGFNTAPGSGTASYPSGTTSNSQSLGGSYSGLGGDVRSSAQDTKYAAQDTAYSAKQTAQDTAYSAKQTAQDTANNASATAQDLGNRASATAQDTANRASATAQDTANNVRATTQNLSNKASATANDAATGIRQRVRKLSVQLDNAADHPAVKNAKGVANRNVSQLREQLGRSKTIRELEARTNVDRVILVVGGVLAYLVLIPLNLFGLALPITNILTILPAAYLATELLDSGKADANDDRVKQLLAYFVVLGLIQTTESLAAGVLERRIPQYYTVKLLGLAYLLHPQTNGAIKVHENVFRPIVQRASAGSKFSSTSGRNDIYNKSSNTVSTPPTSKPSLSTVNSPAQQPTAQTSGYSLADAGAAVGTVPVVVQVPITADIAEDLVRSQQQQY